MLIDGLSGAGSAVRGGAVALGPEAAAWAGAGRACTIRGGGAAIGLTLTLTTGARTECIAAGLGTGKGARGIGRADASCIGGRGGIGSS